MLRQLITKLFGRKPPKITAELDYKKLPILTADQLIQFTEQQNRIRSIKRIIKIDDKHFEVLYLNVIHRFAELVQLMPASQAHHHAVPGGLFIHTLEVIECAMRLRQQYKLPAFVAQEVQERERHVWTYACVFVRDDGQVHSPFEQDLSATACRHYKLVFQDPKYYALHDVIGLSLLDILPPIGKTFLFSHLHIVKEMIAYIHGDKAHAGMIGEVISKADQKSTGQSLAHIPTRKFKGASLENLGERLMTQLRQMIASNDFIINKNNANIYTSKDGYTYCVAKVVVDAIREEMAKQDSLDVPTDNNRIFDTLQEYGFAETNPRTGKSIHTICLYHNGSTKVFTVLKFVTNKLFRVTPNPYEGVIEEVANKAAVKIVSNHATEESTPTVETSPQNSLATSNNPPLSATNTATSEGETIQTMNADDLLGELLANTPEMSGAEMPVSDENGETSGENMAQPTEKITTAIPTTKPLPQKGNLAYQFLAWCRNKVKDKSIIINESNGMIQKVNYKGSPVIAVVTPRIFYEFAEAIGLKNPKDKGSFSKIQSAIHKEKLNIPSHQGQIHLYKIKKSINNPMNGNIKIRHYLFEIERFAEEDTEFMEIMEKIGINGNLVGV